MPWPLIAVAAAEVGGVDQGRAAAVQLAHERIIVATVSGLKRARRGRKVTEGEAGDIGVAGGVHRDTKAMIVLAAAEVGGIDQTWIDGDPLMIVVTGQLESNPMAVLELITADDPPPHAVDILIDDRLMFDNLAASNAYNQVAVSIEPQPVGPVEAEFDLPGSASGASTKSYSSWRWLP